MSGNQWYNHSNVIPNNDIITLYNYLIDYCLKKDIVLLSLLHFRGGGSITFWFTNWFYLGPSIFLSNEYLAPFVPSPCSGSTVSPIKMTTLIVPNVPPPPSTIQYHQEQQLLPAGWGYDGPVQCMCGSTVRNSSLILSIYLLYSSIETFSTGTLHKL